MECENAIFFGRKSKISLIRCNIQQKLQQSVDINVYIRYRLVTYSMTSVTWPLSEFRVISSRSPIWASVCY